MSSIIEKLNKEKAELTIKTDRLLRFIASPKFQSVGSVQRHLLNAQYHSMNSYLNILSLRIDDLISTELASAKQK